jgi:osmotically-inducible protein OsmY
MQPDKDTTTHVAPGKPTHTFTHPEYSDDRIAALAVGALKRENLDAEQRMTVFVDRGWLTISGSASHSVERSAAECVVRCIPGVIGVTNRLVIALADHPGAG